MKAAKKNGITISEMGEMTEETALGLMADIDIDETDGEAINNITEQIEKLVIEYGIDKLKHNFFGDNNEKVTLDYEFFEILGSEPLFKYILAEIKNFSSGFCLGETIGPALITQ